MSVIIKGFDMPEKCAWCSMCCYYNNGLQFFCAALDSAPDIEDIFVSRPEYCPLEEVKDEVYKNS